MLGQFAFDAEGFITPCAIKLQNLSVGHAEFLVLGPLQVLGKDVGVVL